MITNWKRQSIDNMAEAFSSKAERTCTNDEARIRDRHAKIRQFTVERDYLDKAFGRQVTLEGKTWSNLIIGGSA